VREEQQEEVGGGREGGREDVGGWGMHVMSLGWTPSRLGQAVRGGILPTWPAPASLRGMLQQGWPLG
jgi:hypothetical protein